MQKKEEPSCPIFVASEFVRNKANISTTVRVNNRSHTISRFSDLNTMKEQFPVKNKIRQLKSARIN